MANSRELTLNKTAVFVSVNERVAIYLLGEILLTSRGRSIDKNRSLNTTRTGMYKVVYSSHTSSCYCCYTSRCLLSVEAWARVLWCCGLGRFFCVCGFFLSHLPYGVPTHRTSARLRASSQAKMAATTSLFHFHHPAWVCCHRIRILHKHLARRRQCCLAWSASWLSLARLTQVALPWQRPMAEEVPVLWMKIETYWSILWYRAASCCRL